MTKYFRFDIIPIEFDFYLKGDMIMKETKIVLKDIQSVREFVSCVITLEYEVDLVQGRYIVDAKSIMGIFALDILSPITLVAHTEDATDFFNKIAKYIVE